MDEAEKLIARLELEGLPALKTVALFLHRRSLDPEGELFSGDRKVLREIRTLLDLANFKSEEAGFVRALAKAPKDKTVCLILADWLEEQNRPKEATRLRAIHPQPGDAVIVTARHAGQTHKELQRLCKLLESWYPGTHVILWRDREAAIEAYPVRPRQLVVLTVPRQMDDAEHSELWDRLCKLFPENECLVLDGGRRLETATEEQMAKHGWVRKSATE